MEPQKSTDRSRRAASFDRGSGNSVSHQRKQIGTQRGAFGAATVSTWIVKSLPVMAERFGRWVSAWAATWREPPGLPRLDSSRRCRPGMGSVVWGPDAAPGGRTNRRIGLRQAWTLTPRRRLIWLRLVRVRERYRAKSTWIRAGPGDFLCARVGFPSTSRPALLSLRGRHSSRSSPPKSPSVPSGASKSSTWQPATRSTKTTL